MSSQTVVPQKRKRGPKPTGKGLSINVRLQPNDVASLDDYVASGEPMTRPQAIRAILADWLRTHGFMSKDAPKSTGPATDIVKAMDKAITEDRGTKRKNFSL